MDDGLDILNDLLATWGQTGVLPEASPVADVDDVVDVPRIADPALKANVALILATEYGIDVTMGMANDATQSLSNLVKSNTNMSVIPFPSTLPVGSGNSKLWDEDFFPEDETPNF